MLLLSLIQHPHHHRHSLSKHLCTLAGTCLLVVSLLGRFFSRRSSTRTASFASLNIFAPLREGNTYKQPHAVERNDSKLEPAIRPFQLPLISLLHATETTPGNLSLNPRTWPPLLTLRPHHLRRALQPCDVV